MSIPRCAEPQSFDPERWHAALRRLTSPLPGSVPYENRRPIRVPQSGEGLAALDFLARHCPFFSRERWTERLAAGRVLRASAPIAAGEPLRAGERLEHRIEGYLEPPVATDLRVIHECAALLALAKPAPLPMHPGGRFNRNTLVALLAAAQPELRLRPVHRLDADTSGCVVFAKSAAAAEALRRQFAAGEVEKRYLAWVRPAPETEHFTCDAPIGAAPLRAGKRRLDPEQGRAARTEFRLERRLDSERGGGALLSAWPRSGRTHQIRLHLAALGCPIVGDPAYGPGAAAEGEGISQGRLCLHASEMRLRHPESGAILELHAPDPAWLEALSLSQACAETPRSR